MEEERCQGDTDKVVVVEVEEEGSGSSMSAQPIAATPVSADASVLRDLLGLPADSASDALLGMLLAEAHGDLGTAIDRYFTAQAASPELPSEEIGTQKIPRNNSFVKWSLHCNAL